MLPPMPRRKENSRRPSESKRIGGVRITIQNSSNPGRPYKVVMRRDRVRVRESFVSTLVEAKTLYNKWVTEVGNTGVQIAARVTDSDKRLLLDWCEKLAPYGKTPADAVAHFVAHLARCKRSMTVSELSEKLQLFKRRERLGKLYLKDLRYRLGRFCQTFGNRVVSEVTSDEISSWLAAVDGVALTKLNYRRVLGVAFNYAVTLQACDSSPVKGALKPKVRIKSVGILSVTEAASLLKAASDYPTILPAMAIGMFAGLRDSEIERLKWEQVDFDSGHIAILSDTKTDVARHVTLRPALIEWLQRSRQIAGWVYPHNDRGNPSETGRKLIDKASRIAGFGKPGTETEDEKKPA